MIIFGKLGANRKFRDPRIENYSFVSPRFSKSPTWAVGEASHSSTRGRAGTAMRSGPRPNPAGTPMGGRCASQEGHYQVGAFMPIPGVWGPCWCVRASCGSRLAGGRAVGVRRLGHLSLVHYSSLEHLFFGDMIIVWKISNLCFSDLFLIFRSSSKLFSAHNYLLGDKQLSTPDNFEILGEYPKVGNV